MARRDRQNDMGGGIVIIYISTSISFRRRDDLEIGEVESIWLQINLPESRPFFILFSIPTTEFNS